MIIPANLKRASNYDFIDPIGGFVIPGIKFWVHGYHPEIYDDPDKVSLEEHVTTKETDLEKWKEWMEDGRIYVENKLVKAQSTIDYI